MQQQYGFHQSGPQGVLSLLLWEFDQQARGREVDRPGSSKNGKRDLIFIHWSRSGPAKALAIDSQQSCRASFSNGALAPPKWLYTRLRISGHRAEPFKRAAYTAKTLPHRRPSSPALASVLGRPDQVSLGEVWKAIDVLQIGDML